MQTTWNDFERTNKKILGKIRRITKYSRYKLGKNEVKSFTVFYVIDSENIHLKLGTLFSNTAYSTTGRSLHKAQHALPSQNVNLCAYAGWLFPCSELADVATYCLWKASAPRRSCVALLWDIWPSKWPQSRGEVGVGRVSFPVLIEKWAGPTKEQGSRRTESVYGWKNIRLIQCLYLVLLMMRNVLSAFAHSGFRQPPCCCVFCCF